ncbi:MAG: 2-octaprenyl-6-methoxyphenyl hydroxylase [Verrucomicrobiales bacterium]|nr:2-octaprenyl-6-methoxyphenyl hydroxylase [Verrucomicrobiales bacterium]
MISQKLGYSTVLVDRVSHPRFAVGESSTPFSNLLLESISNEFHLPQLAGFIDWGHWQAAHPNIACGLKRGFSFFHHERNLPFIPDLRHANELLVAASPRNSLADTHWFRSEFDGHLAGEAATLGVKFFDRTNLTRLEGLDSDGIVTLAAQRGEDRFTLRTRYVIDATGPRGALFSALNLDEASLNPMCPTQTLFTHFRGVLRWDELFSGNSSEVPPYPIDDAAVHHVFDGGWIWVLRFNNGIVSAGISAREEFAREFGLHEGAAGWDRVLQLFPSIQTLFKRSSAIEPFRFQPRSSFRSARVEGRNWSLLPAAAGFVDPLLSTGFALNLLGILRLARALETHGLRTRAFDDEISSIGRIAIREFEAVSHLVGALFRSMDRFDRFRSLSMLYFAAASFSESAWRLGRESAASSFLLCDQEPFASQLKEICRQVDDPRFCLSEAVSQAIAPFNVAGLCNATRNHWYPVNAGDLISSHAKLGVSRLAVEDLLAKFDC